MGIARISSAAINKVPVKLFHPKNKVGAKRALLELRQVFISRICDEVRESGKCTLISEANGSSFNLKVSCADGIRPDAIADPLNIAAAMRTQCLSSITFVLFPEFNEEIVDEVLIGVISGTMKQQREVIFDFIKKRNEPKPAWTPCPVSAEELSEILFHPETKYNSVIKPLLFGDLLGLHKHQLPFTYAIPIIDKAIEYLRRGKGYRTTTLIRFVFDNTVPPDKIMLFNCMSDKVVSLISSAKIKDEETDRLADQLWWLLYGIRSNLYYRGWAAQVRLRMAQAYAFPDNPEDRDLTRAQECWGLAQDISKGLLEVEGLRREISIEALDQFRSIVPRIKAAAARLLPTDPEAAKDIWRMVFQRADDKVKPILLDEIVKLIFRQIPRDRSKEEKNYASAQHLCKLLYELAEDKDKVVGFTVSLGLKRVDVKLDPKDRETDEAILFWKTAYDLNLSDFSRDRIVSGALHIANKIAKIYEPEKKDILSAMKIWAFVLALDVLMERKLEVFKTIISLASRFAVLSQEMLTVMQENNTLFFRNAELSRYMWRVKIMLCFFCNKNNDVLRLVDTFAPDDYYLLCLKPAVYLRQSLTVDAYQSATRLIEQFKSMEKPDVFQVDGCIRALYVRGFSSMRMMQSNPGMRGQSEQDFNASIELAKQYHLILPERALEGLRQLAKK